MALPGDNFNFAQLASEANLMRCAGSGDRSAFARIIQLHQQRVWNTAFRFTQRPADADDMTQEAFLRLWNAAPRWKPAARLSTWLYRVVANLCVDLHRKEALVPGTLNRDVADNSATPESFLEAGETATRVQQAIGALPDRQRMAVILHRFEGLSYQEISQVTGWGEAAVESLLSRAYASLRTNLADLKNSS